MTKAITKTVTPKYSQQQFDVEIVKGKSIKIECFYENLHVPREFTNEFEIGDEAEYDSWNLRYTGKIVSITEKTVTIDPGCGSRKRRLEIGDFCQRNYDFDAQKVAEYNANESQYL